MSNYNVVYSIRITLDKVYEADSTIGLISYPQNSVFLWSEKAYSLWVPLIVDLGDIKQRGDFQYGGCTTKSDGFSFSILNTEQLSLKLRELGISLQGQSMELIENKGTDSDISFYSSKVVFTGFIDGESPWTEKTVEFQVTTTKFKRRVNLGTVITTEKFPNAKENLNKIIPITYGSSGSFDENRKFVAISTSDKKKILTLADIVAGVSGTGSVYPLNMSRFPVSVFNKSWDNTNDSVVLLLGQLTPTGLPTNNIHNFFTGKFLFIKNGAGQGSARKIIAAYLDSTVSVLLTFDSGFTEELKGNSTANAENQTWCEIWDMDNEFKTDTLPCVGTGVENLSLFSKDKIFSKYGLNIVNSSDHNSVNIQCRFPLDSGGQTFDIYGCLDIKPYDAVSLVDWQTAQSSGYPAPFNSMFSFKKVQSGLFSPSFQPTIRNYLWLNPERATDRNRNTFARFEYEIYNENFGSYKAISFKLPEVSSLIKFDKKCYLGINLVSIYSVIGQRKDPPVRFMTRRFLGGQEIITEYIIRENNAYYKSSPDWWYKDTITSADRDFWASLPEDSPVYEWTLTGYQKFKIADTIDDYKNIVDCILLFPRNAVGENWQTDKTEIYDLSVIVESSIDISSEVFL